MTLSVLSNKASGWNAIIYIFITKLERSRQFESINKSPITIWEKDRPKSAKGKFGPKSLSYIKDTNIHKRKQKDYTIQLRIVMT